MEAEPETFAVRPLREGVDAGKNLGLVYLPPASYQEMMVWAQNPADVPRFRAVKKLLWDAGRGDDAERFVRGTFWRNFLVKYPESNRMHKQALRLSRALDKIRLPATISREARNHIWQAQCNCGYWHGVFGGLYLPHLRFALYRHLIAAQKLLDAKVLARKSAAWEKTDWNFDGRTEHLLNTRALQLSFTAGGAVDQLWLKRTEINLCDTLTRRREAYHANIATGGGGGTKLEDQIGAKEQGLESFLIYDHRVRETCSEWLLPPGTPFEAYRTQNFEPLPALAFGEPVRGNRKAGQEIRFEALAPLNGGQLEVRKTFLIAADGGTLEVRWNLRARSAGVRLRLVAETLFCLLAGNAPDRYVLWEDDDGVPRRDILASHGEMHAQSVTARVRLVDEWIGFRATVTALGGPKLAAPVSLWRDAI
jgi:alpha-amylase